VAGGGLVSMEGFPDQRSRGAPTSRNITAVEHRITTDARGQAHGHKSGLLWLTGLSCAGTSSRAVAFGRAPCWQSACLTVHSPVVELFSTKKNNTTLQYN